MLPLKNLLRRKARSVFAILQIAVAVAAFVSIVGVTQGLRGQFYRISQVFAFDLIVQPDGAASPLFSVVSREEGAQVLAVEGVGAVSMVGIHFMRSARIAQPIGMLALDPGSELLSRYRVVRGRALQPGDRAQLVIGELMAQDLGIDTRALLPDGRIEGSPPVIELLGEQRFEVVGLFEPPLEDVPFLSGQALMSLAYYEEEYRMQPRLVMAHLEPGRWARTPDEVRRGLERCAEVAPAVQAAVPRLRARTIEGFLDTFKQAELIDSFALAISFLAALVSGIGVANTMLMSVFDRTREIGLLRAIGWSRWRIVAMVEAEGVLLAVAGGLLGIPIGLAFIQASTLLVQLGWLNVALDLPLYGKAVAVAAAIGLVGSLYPALRAASLQPTEALRYE